MFGSFGKQGKQNSPNFQGQRVWRRASPALASLEIGHHGIPVFFGKLNHLFIKITRAVFKAEEGGRRKRNSRRGGGGVGTGDT